ncbi:hypothetical protein NQZ68_002620 [Dissostichus eleginoides]|nr:hypothetical protein NQZ68_002620 [Dissostichus eleginoides]
MTAPHSEQCFSEPSQPLRSVPQPRADLFHIGQHLSASLYGGPRYPLMIQPMGSAPTTGLTLGHHTFLKTVQRERTSAPLLQGELEHLVPDSCGWPEGDEREEVRNGEGKSREKIRGGRERPPGGPAAHL